MLFTGHAGSACRTLPNRALVRIFEFTRFLARVDLEVAYWPVLATPILTPQLRGPNGGLRITQLGRYLTAILTPCR